jgi:hypothetical protein
MITKKQQYFFRAEELDNYLPSENLGPNPDDPKGEDVVAGAISFVTNQSILFGEDLKDPKLVVYEKQSQYVHESFTQINFYPGRSMWPFVEKPESFQKAYDNGDLYCAIYFDGEVYRFRTVYFPSNFFHADPVEDYLEVVEMVLKYNGKRG